MEPVSATIARALYAGAVRDLGRQVKLRSQNRSGEGASSSADEIRESIQRICSTRPLILVIDEFGKNLEFYASSGDQGDPFLLQELAETTQGEGALPFVLLTAALVL